MRIYAKVIPRAGKNEVVKVSEGEYKVKVVAPPEKGKANEAVIEAIADFFDVPKSRVSIAGGKTARVKIVDVL
jgi:uncharacterized protein (TIGR00251 family)